MRKKLNTRVVILIVLRKALSGEENRLGGEERQKQVRK